MGYERDIVMSIILSLPRTGTPNMGDYKSLRRYGSMPRIHCYHYIYLHRDDDKAVIPSMWRWKTTGIIIITTARITTKLFVQGIEISAEVPRGTDKLLYQDGRQLSLLSRRSSTLLEGWGRTASKPLARLPLKVALPV